MSAPGITSTQFEQSSSLPATMHPAGRWIGLSALFALVIVTSCIVALPVSLSDLWAAGDRGETARFIVLGLRLPRVVGGLFVGAALATSGAALQAVFRNPLAEPYLLGISAGGALGATLAAALRLPAWGGFDAATLLAYLGALLATMAVYRLGQTSGQSIPNRGNLLLIGVALSALLAAIMALVVTLSNRVDLAQQTTFWLLGGLMRVTWQQDIVLLVTLAIGLVLLMASARDLNALSVGDQEAASLGVPVARVHRRLLAIAALMSAAAVATAGLIGFIGLLAPHLMRQLFPGSARALIPAAALGGATLLVACDTIARSALNSVEIPVGVVTALLGVPLFLFLARRS